MIEDPRLALVAVAVSVALLWKGAEWVVVSASRLARRFGLSDLTIGLTVVALGTSAPEFVVTLVAALSGQAAISLGNVVGSNIFNTGLILGACSMLWAVPVSGLLIRRDLPLLLAGTALVLGLTLDQNLARWEGLVMFGLLALYIATLLRASAGTTLDAEEVPSGVGGARDLLLLLLGLACVCGGAHLLIQSAIVVAHALGISNWLIAVTIVAGGTSLPEFATSIAAARHGRTGMICGNLVGSDLFNLLGVLGLAVAIHPLQVDSDAVVGLCMMLGAVALLWVTTLGRLQLPRAAGAVLILVALARWSRDAFIAG